MARLLGLFAPLLPFQLAQDDIRSALEANHRTASEATESRAKLLASPDRSGVGSRASIVSIADALLAPDFTERNRRYAQAMIEHGGEAVRGVLEGGGFDPKRFHTWITVSCTGVMIPAADAFLAHRFGFSPALRRIPMTELGCVGGAVALSRAAEAVDAHAGSAAANGSLARADLALLLAAEFCSLNLQLKDASPAGLVANLLFGDGVVAVVLGPDDAVPIQREPRRLLPRVVACRSHLVPSTTGHLGFDLRSSGFHIVLKPEIPRLVESLLPGVVASFLYDLSWHQAGVRHWIVHPGGKRVVEAMLGALGLPEEAGEATWSVMRRHGNASSAGVLLVLEEAARAASPGDRGLLVGFGPGFSVELLALEW